jgi:hypothetical protein
MTASSLSAWSNFYVMAATSAASLTGLMFVVITLVTRSERRPTAGIATFTTPTVVHFGAALFVSLVLGAPWTLIVCPAFLVAALGLGGVLYILLVSRRALRLQGVYEPDAEDLAFYRYVPYVAYALLAASGIALAAWPHPSLYGIAAGVVLLIFIGIHNAWDIVTYITIGEGAQD